MKKIHIFLTSFHLLTPSLYAVMPEPAQPLRVTIWVHGTQVQKLLPSLMLALHKKTVSFFESIPSGLAHVDSNQKIYTSIIARCLADASPTLFPYEHFYHFGWSGDAQVHIRRDSGYQLYQDIKSLIARYKTQYGCEPIITIITHSHGGNVVLHMHECIKEDSCHFIVDKLLLLACPIQIETLPYTESPLFKYVMNIYSNDDLIQVIDPQCLQPFIGNPQKKSFSKAWNMAIKRPFFSKRCIKNTLSTCNIKVSWIAGAPWDECEAYIPHTHITAFKWMSDAADFFNKQRGLSHIEIELPFFLKHLPGLLDHIQQGSLSPYINSRILFHMH